MFALTLRAVFFSKNVTFVIKHQIVPVFCRVDFDVPDDLHMGIVDGVSELDDAAEGLQLVDLGHCVPLRITGQVLVEERPVFEAGQ